MSLLICLFYKMQREVFGFSKVIVLTPMFVFLYLLELNGLLGIWSARLRKSEFSRTTTSITSLS